MAQRQAIQPVLYELGYEVGGGDEEDSACWLEAVLRREPASIFHTMEREEGIEKSEREPWQKEEEPRA
jgi:hypothetical protein